MPFDTHCWEREYIEFGLTIILQINGQMIWLFILNYAQQTILGKQCRIGTFIYYKVYRTQWIAKFISRTFQAITLDNWQSAKCCSSEWAVNFEAKFLIQLTKLASDYDARNRKTWTILIKCIKLDHRANLIKPLNMLLPIQQNSLSESNGLLIIMAIWVKSFGLHSMHLVYDLSSSALKCSPLLAH